MTTKNLFPDLKSKSLTPAAARKSRINWTDRVRRLSKLGFAAFILYTSVVHGTAADEATTASIDALCPFGALETSWKFISTGGQFISKTHVSNVVLGLGLLIGVLIAGGAFCGWVCPFGAVQDLMNWIRRKLHVREIQVSPRVDRILRYGRFVVLGMVLYQTISTVKLWFADWDPYRTLFGLGWLFEFNLATSWFAYAVVIVVLGVSLFVERAWCRYACPLGGAISLLGNFSLLRMRRSGDACKGCNVCQTPCPVKLPVATANTISSDCIGCLACVQACPRPGALELKLAPTWFDGIRKILTKQAEVSHAR
ncbi:MAG: 4Fe-4S binding protein [Chloroflexi bacterium]|nr:4Fe-4S binding protein [Chloroflexota bacterium]